MPRVALVFPYFRTHAPTEMLFQPLGVATLAGQLRALGVEVRVFDGTFSTFERLRDDVVAYRPAIVGLSSMVTLMGNTLRLAGALRTELPGALLVAGGPLPSLFPGRYAPFVDAVFRGEADLSFPRFCRDYFAAGATPATLSDLPLESYDGLVMAGDGGQERAAGTFTIDNPPVHHAEAELPTFPLPYRGDGDHAAYQRAWLERDGTRPATILTAYGCPYHCDFCSKPVFGDEFRHRGLDAVFVDIEQIVALGYDSLWIADDTFTVDQPYLEEFCRRIAGRGIGWTCLSRASGIGATTVRLMKAAGCRRVYLGLESGSQATLDLMHKQITVADGRRCARLYREAGIGVAAFFIVGYPGETTASIEQTFALALELPLDEISFNVPFPLPGSALFERLGGSDTGMDWNEENEVTFVYDSEFDAAWLRRRIAETMAAFAARRGTAAAGAAVADADGRAGVAGAAGGACSAGPAGPTAAAAAPRP